MKSSIIKTVISIIILIMTAPALSIAQPPGPGDGQDSFATPVNGGVAFVAAIAFLFGLYRIYQLNKKSSVDKID